MNETTRFFVLDFLAGSPILIDREAKRLVFYDNNIQGQIYNLKKPECRNIDKRWIDGLIRRTQGLYHLQSAKAVDGYVYKYLMLPDEQAQCGAHPTIFGGRDTIAQTDSFTEAIRQMCEWTYDRERGGDPEEKARNREAMLQYCENFLDGDPQPPAPSPKERGRER